MTEKYIKRTKKGKGRKLKEVKKSIEKFTFDIVNNPEFYVKPIVKIAISLMIIDDLNKRKKENQNKIKKEVKYCE